MVKFKRFFGFFIIFGLGIGCIATLVMPSEKFRRDKTPAIGIFLSFSHPSFEECSQSFQTALMKQGQELRFVILNADYSISKARQVARYFYKNSSIQGIFTIGALATKVMSQIEEKKPLVFSAIHDAEALSFYRNSTNIHGVEDRLDVDQIFFAVKALNSKPQSVMYLQAANETFSHILVRDIKKKFVASGIEFFEETLSTGNVKLRLKQVLEKSPSVIFLPLDPFLSKNITFIAEEAFRAKIPIVTGDISLVDKGICAACCVDYKRSGEQAALMMKLLLQNNTPVDKVKQISLEPLPQFITFNDDYIKELGLKLNKSEKKQIRTISLKNDHCEKNIAS